MVRTCQMLFWINETFIKKNINIKLKYGMKMTIKINLYCLQTVLNELLILKFPRLITRSNRNVKKTDMVVLFVMIIVRNNMLSNITVVKNVSIGWSALYDIHQQGKAIQNI